MKGGLGKCLLNVLRTRERETGVHLQSGLNGLTVISEDLMNRGGFGVVRGVFLVKEDSFGGVFGGASGWGLVDVFGSFLEDGGESS